MAPRVQTPDQSPLTPPISPAGKAARVKTGRVQRKVRSVSGPATLSNLQTPGHTDTPSNTALSPPEPLPHGTRHKPIDLTIDSPVKDQSISQSIEQSLPTLRSVSEPNLLVTPPPPASPPTTPTPVDDGPCTDTEIQRAQPQTPTKSPSTRRKSLRGRATTTPDTVKNKRNNGPFHIDHKLDMMLHEIINTTKKTKAGESTPRKLTPLIRKFSEPGFVYVFGPDRDAETTEDEEGGDSPSASASASTPVVVKVGFSKEPLERCQKLGKHCVPGLKQVVNWKQSLLPRGMVAERLAQQELEPWQHDFECKCPTKHSEFFEVSEANALKVVQRWVAFCHRKPWDAGGRLRPFWDERLKQRRESWEREEHRIDDERWEEYTRPAFWEEPLHDLCSFFQVLSDEMRQIVRFVVLHRWPLLCFTQWMCTMCKYAEFNMLMLAWMLLGVFMIVAEQYKVDS